MKSKNGISLTKVIIIIIVIIAWVSITMINNKNQNINARKSFITSYNESVAEIIFKL